MDSVGSTYRFVVPVVAHVHVELVAGRYRTRYESMPLASVAFGHTRWVTAVDVPRVVSTRGVAVTGSGWTGSVKSMPVATSRTRPLLVLVVTELPPFQPLRISLERS